MRVWYVSTQGWPHQDVHNDRKHALCTDICKAAKLSKSWTGADDPLKRDAVTPRIRTDGAIETVLCVSVPQGLDQVRPCEGGLIMNRIFADPGTSAPKAWWAAPGEP